MSWWARSLSSTPMMGRIRSRSRTCSTGVDSSRSASCCCRMTRSRSSTKLHRHGVRDPVRRRLVGVEHAVEQLEVVAVLLEERPGEDVAEQQDDPDHLVRLDAARDDPLGQVAGVVAQLLDAARLQHRDVVVVDRRDLAEHLLGSHRRQQVRLVDPVRPIPAAASRDAL